MSPEATRTPPVDVRAERSGRGQGRAVGGGEVTDLAAGSGHAGQHAVNGFLGGRAGRREEEDDECDGEERASHISIDCQGVANS